jgi:uncharacterized protein (DUF1810 family)
VKNSDPHNLQRFLAAQEKSYGSALRELAAGKKRSHWIWYIFPQVAGLGYSSTAQFYAIQSKEEAVAYLGHDILGSRLRECCEALLRHRGKKIHDIMGYPDDLKLCSSLTLFAFISAQSSIFHKVLSTFYAGQMDEKTAEFLSFKK